MIIVYQRIIYYKIRLTRIHSIQQIIYNTIELYNKLRLNFSLDVKKFYGRLFLDYY